MSKKIQVTFMDDEWEQIQLLNKEFRIISESALVRMLALQRVDDLREKKKEEQPKG